MKVFRFIPYKIRERAALLFFVAAVGAFVVSKVADEPPSPTIPEVRATVWLTDDVAEYRKPEFWVDKKSKEPEAFTAAGLLCESGDPEYINCAALRAAGGAQ